MPEHIQRNALKCVDAHTSLARGSCVKGVNAGVRPVRRKWEVELLGGRMTLNCVSAFKHCEQPFCIFRE